MVYRGTALSLAGYLQVQENTLKFKGYFMIFSTWRGRKLIIRIGIIITVMWATMSPQLGLLVKLLLNTGLIMSN